MWNCIPCLRHKNVKLYTLFKTEGPENDTLTGGTSLYRKYMEVLPGGLCEVAELAVNLFPVLLLSRDQQTGSESALVHHVDQDRAQRTRSCWSSTSMLPFVGSGRVGSGRVGSGVWSVVPTPLHAWSGDPRSALNNVSCLGWLYFVMPWCSCVDVLVFVVWNSFALLTVECCGLDESWGPVSQAPQDRGWCGFSIGATRVHSTSKPLWANTSCMDHTKSLLVIYLRGNPTSVFITLGTYMRSLLWDMKENVRALL